MTELWKKINDYNYEISNFGNVRCNKTKESIVHIYDKPGEPRKYGSYPRVQLIPDIVLEYPYHNKDIYRLVAEYFVPNPRKNATITSQT